MLAPVILALSKGNDWGWASAATLGCFAVSIVSLVLFVTVERRVEAPLVDLQLLRNRVLVGATLAILLVAGTINALMYVLSLYFQNPDALGMSAFEAGLATLPAAAAMIVDHARSSRRSRARSAAAGRWRSGSCWRRSASACWRSSRRPGRTSRSSAR